MTTTTMAAMGTTDQILKIDTVGRIRTGKAQREAILDEFERSGGSGAQFAALLGIKYATFASWVQKRRRERGLANGCQRDISAGTPALHWVEAVVENRMEPSQRQLQSVAVRVSLPGGAEVEMNDPGQAGLVAALLGHLAGKESATC